MIRVADYIANFVYEQGVRDVFMVTGGGMMFLSDGVAKQGKLNSVCSHHEQASAMGAVAYAKHSEHLGVCYLTTGCGGTNGITGLLNAWQDNIPCLFISGQSKRKETVRNSGLKLRQLGVQEADIISVVESLTKYAVMVNEPEMIRYHFEKALYLAKNGRPGPVWIDVPLDVQGAMIDPANLKKFEPSEMKLDYSVKAKFSEINKLAEMISQAKRPIIVCGQGVRLSKSISEFRSLIEKYKIPVVASRLGIDVLPSEHELFIGRIGTKGDRAGNFAVQNADLVIAMGSRLSVSSTGHEYNLFAREAKLVVVDIDPIEHSKNTVKIDLFINADIKNFLQDLPILKFSKEYESRIWQNKCLHWKNKWPVCLPEYSKSEKINLYYFTDRLTRKMKNDSVVVSDAGSAFYVVSQAGMFKETNRYITSGGQAEMGWTMPAAIGVAMSAKGKEVLGVTGDGSFQMNIQELQTIKHHNLPIKLFVWNNDGYLSIRASQTKFFEGRYIGTDDKSGVSFPDTKKITEAYGLKYFKAETSAGLDNVLDEVFAYNGPVVCEVMCIRDQEIIPAVASKRLDDGRMISKPIEDMYPFLSREELISEMIIKPLEE